MAMSISTLAAELKTEIENQFGTPADSAQLLKFTTAVSTAVINHIKNNATITLTAGDISVPGLGLLDSVSGVVTGSASNAAATLNTKIT